MADRTQATAEASGSRQDRLVKRLRLCLGWLCYWPVMAWPTPWNPRNRLFMWLLSWAGYYAHRDTGA